MQSKQCFKCHKTKPIYAFYTHPGMADGHLNKCKECTKINVSTRYKDPEAYKRIQDYERKRSQDPDRKAKTLEYQRKRRAKYPGKNRARHKVDNAVRDGKIERRPCEICGNPKSEGHHTDYRKKLDVKWLCFTHHRQAHGQMLVA